MRIQEKPMLENEEMTPNRKRSNKLIPQERRYVDRIFHKYNKDILRYLNSLLRSKEDAKDLLQETYLKICSRKNIAQLDYNIKGYLFVVATNLTKDFIRKKVAKKESYHISLEGLDFKSPEASPENILEWKENLQSVKKSLLKLDERPKKIFIMRRFMGYSTSEIAQDLKLSKRTIERDLSIAFEKIKHDLKNIDL